MEATQRAISRASDISAVAEKVIDMLGLHKKDVEAMRVKLAARFTEIRTILDEDEKLFVAHLDQLGKELDEAIAALQGKVAPTEAAQLAEAITGGGDGA
jgi:(p)ppGpp synthase/HD superfamily hydrolase